MKIYKIADQEEVSEEPKVPTPEVVEEEVVFGDLKLYVDGQTPDEEPSIVKKPEEYLADVEQAVDEPAQLFLFVNLEDYAEMLRLWQHLYGEIIANWIMDTSTKAR